MGIKTRLIRYRDCAFYPIFGGVMLAVSFPDTGLYPLAWICLIPLLRATANVRLKQVFIRAFIFALTSFAIDLSWVRITMTEYGGLPAGLSITFMLMLAAYCSLYLMAAVGVSRYFERRLNLRLILILPFSWVGFEYLRSVVMTGFPWNSLGQSQYPLTYLIQNADWGSFYCISWIIVAVNIAVYDFIFRTVRRGAVLQVIIALSLLILMFAYGLFRLEQPLSGVHGGLE